MNGAGDRNSRRKRGPGRRATRAVTPSAGDLDRPAPCADQRNGTSRHQPASQVDAYLGDDPNYIDPTPATSSPTVSIARKGTKMLQIQQADGERYTAKVGPPHSSEHWETLTPLTREALVDKLVQLGVHQMDIVDQFAYADPNYTPPVPNPSAAGKPRRKER